MKFSMKSACKNTGLTADTLRAWERRYGAVRPERLPNGRRSYAEADLERLRLLKTASELGHPIGLLSALDDIELKKLLSIGTVAKNGHGAKAKELIEDLLASVLREEMEDFQRSLSWAAATLPPRALIGEVLFPLLTEVGERWHRGDLSIAQEHAVSSALRNLIGAMIRMFPEGDRPKSILFATLSGERHEFGILLLALLAASEGVRCCYLGPDLPAEEVARAARGSRADVIAISIVAGGEESARQLADLASRTGGDARIWIGGPGALDAAAALPDAKLDYVSDFAAFQRRIAELKL